jgi:CTP:molybdopterin cytidylyltransferase MocA
VTVAAVILSATPEGAVRDVEGRPLVRRLAEVAWSGGAVPVVIVAADPDGAVAEALGGTTASLAEPAPTIAGPVGQICRGIDVARGLVAETDAAVIWPARMAWVDPETLTSLIEAHGAHPTDLLRPAFDGAEGWPALLPIAHLEALRALAPDRMPDELLAELVAGGVPARTVEAGDPGVTHDIGTAHADLPPYGGPPEPASGKTYEWGALAGEAADEPVPAGPTIVAWRDEPEP